jgi:hypothetical protein
LLFIELCETVRAGDAVSIRAKSHALKGLMAGCGGVRAANAAQKLEAAACAGDLTHASTLAETVGEELEKLKQALLDYRG